jgi:hypothetical protein
MAVLSSARRSKAARPAGAASPCSTSSFMRSTLTALHVLLGLRGVKRIE